MPGLDRDGGNIKESKLKERASQVSPDPAVAPQWGYCVGWRVSPLFPPYLEAVRSTEPLDK